MLTDDRWCSDVVNQLAAVTRETQKVAAGLPYDHARHCVLEAAHDSGEAGQARMDEVAAAIRQVGRLRSSAPEHHHGEGEAHHH